MISYRDALYHDGKPGMTWGVRRYRNYDGTLTEAGRKRYGVGPARNKSEGGRKLSRAERKAAKEIKKKASAKAAEKKAKQMRDEARKALEELQKEREALDRARADREQNSATAEGNAQMKLNNELLKMRVEQLKTQREYDSLLHPTKQKVPLSKRLGDLADNSRKLVAFGKDIAELSAAIKKAKNGDTKSALDILKDQETIDKLKFAMESRAKTRAEWEAKENAAKAAAAKEGGPSREESNRDHKESEGVNSRNNKDENAYGAVNYPNYNPPRQRQSQSEPSSGSSTEYRRTAWESLASHPDYSTPALPPHEEPKSRKKKRKG